jgi:hypothetical protein
MQHVGISKVTMKSEEEHQALEAASFGFCLLSGLVFEELKPF